MRSVLIWIVIVTCVNSGCKDEPSQPSQQFSRDSVMGGTYWVDRWGQGRLDNQECFVDDALLPRLREYEGTRIALFDTLSDQEMEPGTPVVMEFDSAKSLPQQARDIRLRWLDGANRPVDSPVRRMRNGQEVSFEVQMTNREADELILDTNELDLWLTVQHQAEGYLTASRHSFGKMHGGLKRERGVLRYFSYPANLLPQDTRFTSRPHHASSPQPRSEAPVRVKSGESFSWKVTISGWLPNEYEMMVSYHKYHRDEKDPILYGFVLLSNPISLDVLSDEPRQDDLIELHVRQRDQTDLKPGQPVPLEIVFQNRSENELIIHPGNSGALSFQEHVSPAEKLQYMKGTPDDLDLSDMLFCYGSDGRLLPITSKVAGPMEIRIPVNQSFTLPVDAPAGTEIARAVFHNSTFTPKLTGERDPNRYVHGWHWSEHWQHPSVRQQVP